MPVKLNHKTQLIRLIERGATLARVDETECGGKGAKRIIRGYTYEQDGRRILKAQVSAPESRR